LRGERIEALSSVTVRRLACFAILFGCKRETPPQPIQTSSASVAVSASAPAPAPDIATEARELLVTWDRGFNAHDADALAPLYASSVRYYGATLTRDECKSKVAAFIGTNPTSSQTSTVEGVATEPDGVRVTFSKAITIAGKTTRYPSYLHVARTGRRLEIDEESDPTTDKNLHITTCEDALGELARVTDALTHTGLRSEVTHDGTKWEAHFYRSHGTSDIYFDSKTGVITWATTGSDIREPLNESSPQWSPGVRVLVDAVKAKCK
jgi:hypothetical protein